MVKHSIVSLKKRAFTVSVRQVRMEDADYLAPKLRKADLQEIKAVSGEVPQIALERSIEWSDTCYAIVNEKDKPIALFGVIPDLDIDSSGFVWFLGSNELPKHSVTFLRHSKEWIDKLHQRFHRLWNYIDVRNEVHIRWLKWCGFTCLGRIEEYGVEKRPFYEFEKIGKLKGDIQSIS